MLEEYVSHIFCRNKKPFLENMTFRAFERNRGSGPKFHKKNQRCVFKLCMLNTLFANQTRYLEEKLREQNSNRCDDSPQKKDVYVGSVT